MTSVTQTLAEWIAGAGYDDVPEVALRRVEERFVDSLGVQLAGMATSTGQTLLGYLRGFGTPNPESSVVGSGYKTTTAFATLMNGTAGHALEFDDISAFSGHYANPLTAATLAVGEKLGVSGRDLIVAWMVGYEVIWRTAKPTADHGGSKLLQTGWFNQGFQPVMGVAAATAKLMGLDVTQIRMAIGHAASAMGGVQKNRASDTKGFTAGSAAMHGVMAAELVSLGFTGNPDILDGDDGVIRMIGQEVGDPQKVIDDLGTWDMAERGSTMRLNASCAAGHWGMAAIGSILDDHPLKAEEIESIDVRLPAFLEQSKPYHHPRAGLEGKYSVEYDMVAMVLDGQGGLAPVHRRGGPTSRGAGADEAGALGPRRGSPQPGHAGEHGGGDPEGRDPILDHRGPEGPARHGVRPAERRRDPDQVPRMCGLRDARRGPAGPGDRPVPQAPVVARRGGAGHDRRGEQGAVNRRSARPSVRQGTPGPSATLSRDDGIE